MVKPWVNWTLFISTISLLAPFQTTLATPSPQANVIIPTTQVDDPLPSRQLQNSYNLEIQPASPSESDSELPATERPEIKPLYQLEPFRIEERPVRLEISLSRRKVSVLKGNSLIRSYPIAVGRPGWETPLGTFQVRQMLRIRPG
jgi:hypothetical protein